ncbi:hypothetical protein [Methyloversatilis thermotolerans]|uniref:hypothetical protein n=1 Tax=Methyloversatilis thermotolerans TaxID=1346290 RepID=UPI000361AB60|nr:hypothetical protein [Methyloversatilis thermotolerans]
MRKESGWFTHGWVAAACFAALAGCQKQEGVMERAGKQGDQAVEEAARDVKRVTDQAGESMDEARRKAGESLEKAGEKMQESSAK